MAPQFIYFDLGQVLLRFSRERQYRQMAEVAGIPVERVREVWELSGLYERYESGDLTSREVFDEFCQRAEITCDFSALQKAGNDIFWPNTSMVAVVGQLWSAGYRLGILSNTCASHWEFISDGHIGIIPAYFETCVLSYEVGAMKPDARIYQTAVDRAGVPPDQIFYMDDIQDNVQGAWAAGFDAVLYTDTPSLVRELHHRGVRFNY